MLILKLLKYSILTVLGVIHVSNDVYFNGKKLKKFIRCANILPTNTLWKEIAKCRMERETNTWSNHVNLVLKVRQIPLLTCPSWLAMANKRMLQKP